MASLGGDPRRLEPGRTATHDEDATRLGRRRESVAAPLPLAPGRRVDQARDPVVARSPAPAQLVARDARPDLVGPPRPRLGHEMRVGDLAADDADEVGVAGGQDRLRRGRRPDVALALDERVADDRLERGRERLAEALLVERRRDDLVEVQVRTRPAGHVVHQPALVVPGDDLGQLVHGRQRRRPGVGADRQPDDEVVAAGLADPSEDLGREAHPALDRAAPVVAAAVRPGCPELVHQRVVGGEDLDPVEAAGLGPSRRRDEARR